MSKFATATPPNVKSPITTTGPARTYEGGAGWSRDAKSDLFLLAVTNMVREDTFYEDAAKRDARFEDLVHTVTAEDPEWVAAFVPWLRDVAQMRSASLVMAAEYVKAGGPNGRRVVASALRRADEPAEMLGYWHQTHGRKLPAAVKRGVADAVTRLYNERAALRYDGNQRVWRFGDVIDLVHPVPSAPWQAALFRYLLDTRHGREDPRGLEVLATIATDRRLMAMSPDLRRPLLGVAVGDAGWSWERVSGWLPGGMDAEAWTALIPRMGYMALLRNLRNFDEAGVSDEAASLVVSKLVDPEEVAGSRQFPIRFLSAYKAVQSLRWAYPLERALNLSVGNVPALPGRTLVMVDVSGSMTNAGYLNAYHRGWKDKSTMPWEHAAIFGSALALRAEHADLFSYGTIASPINVTRGGSVLKLVDAIRQSPAFNGGTQTIQIAAELASRAHYDRLVIVTDEQAFAADRASHATVDRIPLIFTFNMAGYKTGHLPSGEKGRYTFGGLTDACFQMIPILEAQRDGVWPHMVTPNA